MGVPFHGCGWGVKARSEFIGKEREDVRRDGEIEEEERAGSAPNVE